MNAGGWCMLGVSWTAILALAGWCTWKILTTRKDNIHAPLDIDTDGT